MPLVLILFRLPHEFRQRPVQGDVDGAAAVLGQRRDDNLVDQAANLGMAGGTLDQLRVDELVVLDPAEKGVEASAQRVDGRQVRLWFGQLAQLLGRRGQGRLEVVLLAREIVVQQRLGDVRGARDVGHRELVV